MNSLIYDIPPSQKKTNIYLRLKNDNNVKNENHYIIHKQKNTHTNILMRLCLHLHIESERLALETSGKWDELDTKGKCKEVILTMRKVFRQTKIKFDFDNVPMVSLPPLWFLF